MGFVARKLAEQAAASALDDAGISSARSALVMASAACGPEIREVADATCSVLGTTAVVGASMSGLFTKGQFCENIPAVSVLALDGIDVESFAVTELRGEEARAGEELATRFSPALGTQDLVVVFPDAQSLVGRPLISGLREHLGEGLLLGAGALGTPGEAAFQWVGRDVFSDGVAGLRLRFDQPLRLAVAHPIRQPEIQHEVTRSEGAWLLGLDGRPALEVFREQVREPLAQELRRAATRVRVCAFPGVPDARSAPPHSVVGFDEGRSAFALPVFLERGDRVAFGVQEAGPAREQLQAALERLGSPEPTFGLVLSTRARGPELFGEEGLEAALVTRAYPQASLLGIQGAYTSVASPNLAVGGLGDLLSASAVMAFLDA